ncbi:MAG: hypothetical protein GX442_24065 [Candidatus Riflebacteria bacterium]|nr:hypothetical protein [Candidatus Riflebacteria bacterium]
MTKNIPEISGVFLLGQSFVIILVGHQEDGLDHRGESFHLLALWVRQTDEPGVQGEHPLVDHRVDEGLHRLDLPGIQATVPLGIECGKEIQKGFGRP